MSAAPPDPHSSNWIRPPARDWNDGEERDDVWGFRDTAFHVNERGHVALSGSRYAFAGTEFPDFLPWVRRTLGVPLDPLPVHASEYPPLIPEPVHNAAFLGELEKFLRAEQISREPRVRLRHGHGHTQAEMYAIKYGALARVPDVVLFPDHERQVEQIVQAARRHGACIIPYGGGTNVTQALLCPPGEQRAIASVDLRRLNHILWIDPHNRQACIQAGAVGRHIAAQLAEHGFTLGHEPDSLEHSTLGGWIATHASGMKKNRYGNIEELVLDVEAVTADGSLTRSRAFPRESTGLDPRRWLLGSEGNLGIVTRAVVKLAPLPELCVHDSAVFRDFESGIEFLYELTRRGRPPASVRLLDNAQFQLGQALRPPSEGLAALRRRVERWFATRLRGFEPERMVACTFVFEGSREEVHAQQRATFALVRQYGGMRAGRANGERGYQLTFSIAYLRDFIMNHCVLAESFEATVPWSHVVSLCANVKHCIEREHRVRGLPGRPFVTCRATQVYATGVCVYFYFAYYHDGVERPSDVYAEIEHAARVEVLRSGGSLSHHHGVGKLRREFLPEIMSETALAWTTRLKDAVDPDNVFAAGNLFRR